jgi:hypothetical protein
LTPEEIYADDEHLTKTKSTIENMPVGKKVQTCDLLLANLKENLEFMMLNPVGFEKLKKQLVVLISCLDASTKLLFAQNIAGITTDDGNSLLELLFDIFESELLQMLDMSDATRKAILEKSKK